MGAGVVIIVWSVFCVAVGIFIAGANPEMAAKWDTFRRKAIGG